MTYYLTEENSEELEKKISSDMADFIQKCQEYGYTPVCPYWIEKKFQIYFMADEKKNKFLPEVYMIHSLENYKAMKVEFQIQTSSYGGLDLEDYHLFLQACLQAEGLVKYLETVDFSTFPKVENQD